jgi:hypothetical protein
MPGAGLGSNISGTIIRNDIADVLDPFSFVLSRGGFIGERICPYYGVRNRFGEFPKKLLTNFLKRVETKRMEDGTLNRIATSIGTTQYTTRPFGLEYPIDHLQEDTYRGIWNMELDGINMLQDVMAREYEIHIADLVQRASSYDGDDATWRIHTVSKPWNDPDALILDDIEDAMLKRDKKVPEANCLIVSKRLYRQFSRNNQILGRISSHGAGVSEMPSNVTMSRLADLFNVEYILIGKGYYDDSKELSTDSEDDDTDDIGYKNINLNNIWRDDVAELGWILPPGQKVTFQAPVFGYTLVWERGPGGRGEVIDMYQEPRRNGRVYRIQKNYEVKLVGNRATTQLRGLWQDPQ